MEWADLYSDSDESREGFRQAENIFLHALSVPGFSKIPVIRERLRDVRKERARQPTPVPAEAARPAQEGSKRKVGRNKPCPCGSGLNYKRCHGK